MRFQPITGIMMMIVYFPDVTMEKIFITIVILYSLFVGIALFRLSADKRRKKYVIGQGDSFRENKVPKTDIVGESHFNLKSSKPLTVNAEPLNSNLSKTEKEKEKADIFALPYEGESTVKVSPDKLDETFSETPSGDDNEPMDIDYPIEYETESRSEEDLAEEETEVIEGMARAMLASGVRFEDLGNMVRTVSWTDRATSQQRQKAGETLLEIRRSDLFEQLVSGKPDAKRIVTELMAESFAAFYERKDRETGILGNATKIPDDFNIIDFV